MSNVVRLPTHTEQHFNEPDQHYRGAHGHRPTPYNKLSVAQAFFRAEALVNRWYSMRRAAQQKYPLPPTPALLAARENAKAHPTVPSEFASPVRWPHNDPLDPNPYPPVHRHKGYLPQEEIAKRTESGRWSLTRQIAQDMAFSNLMAWSTARIHRCEVQLLDAEDQWNGRHGFSTRHTREQAKEMKGGKRGVCS